jgi:transposase-like protein
MISHVLHCPHGHGTDIVRHGKWSEGKQHYRCRECRQGRGRTVLLDSTYAGPSPEVKRQLIDTAMHAHGIRDTARVLRVSPTTVINERNKRNPSCTRSIRRCWRPCIRNRSRWRYGGRTNVSRSTG